MGRGDRDAFEALYDRFAGPLYRVALRWLGDRADAEDLVSETLLRVWRHAPRYDSRRGTASSWVFGIARHVALDTYWERARASFEPLGETAEPAGVPDLDGPEAAFDLAAALQGLPDPQRRVIEMAYLAGRSEREIAAALGIPVGTVKSRRFHALRSLARALRSTPTPAAGVAGR